MFGTEKSKRTAPARRFENYVFTKFVDPSVGLTGIPDSNFTRVTGSVGPGTGTSFNDDSWSAPIAIGFPFSFDNITYDHFVVDTNGWMTLVDPVVGTFTITDVMAVSAPAATTVDFDNASIAATNATNDVLLAPWFDDLFNVVGDPGDLLATPFSFNAGKVRNIVQGIEAPEAWINSVGPGVRYYRDDRSRNGRRLIVRWSSLTSKTYLLSVVSFEVVIYENGTIEYRYAPKLLDIPTSKTPNFHGASIGVFAPGTNRFRDFAVGLDYRRETRQEYIYGGYVYDSSFTDTDKDGTVANYAVNLSARTCWPGRNGSGCLMTFSPPAGRRKVLPRKQNRAADSDLTYPIVARTGANRLRSAKSSFDDRRSPTYRSGTLGAPLLVNYPTTLTRFFGGNSRGVLERQNLFSGDFLVTGSMVKSVIDDYLGEGPSERIDPFNENALFEQGVVSGEFFTTGSETQQFAGKFDQNLKSKTQIRISLPINNPVSMPGSTSSIYYYNSRAKAWNLPTNASYVITGTTKVPAGRGDLSSPRQYRNILGGGTYFEDFRGFGAIGNIIASGSHVPAAGNGSDQSDFAIGSQYVPNRLATVLGHQTAKSVACNVEYDPINDETFTLPITSPFLIEKAVIEIPFGAGPTWFSDNTQNFISYIADLQATAYDFAGPALTVALHRRVVVQNDVTGSRRDLILTGTIIPSTDYISGVKIDQDPAYAGVTTFIRPFGFLSYASTPGAVVTPNTSNFFSGSVQVKCAALSAVGVVAQYVVQFRTTGADDALATRRLMTEQPTLSLADSTSGIETNKIVAVSQFSPFGRGGSGFRASGRSVMGKESATFQGTQDRTGFTVPNPFYVGPNGLTAQNEATLSNTGAFGFAIAAATIQRSSHVPCPYLVMPGDQLVLSISKTRPIVYSRFGSGLSGSQLPHDVSLLPGNINITLYGSLVKEDAEYHDPVAQPLGSNVVHEVIGNDPVVDQYNVAYDSEFSGSMITDLFSLESAIPYLYYGARTFRGQIGMSASYGSTRYYGHMSTRGNEDRQSISQQLFWTKRRKVFEYKKRSRTFNAISDTETFWDSRIPDAATVMEFISPRMNLVAGSGPLGTVIGDYVIFTGRTGTFCGVPFIVGASTYNQQGLHDWIMTYPFESKYKDITSTFADKIVDNKLWSIAFLSGGGSIAPPGGFYIPLGGLTIEFGQASGSVGSGGGVNRFNGIPPTRGWASEGDSGITQGLGLPEFIKFFYGFGDGRSNVDNGHVKFSGIEQDFNGFQTGAEVRGWRHGMISAFPLKTSAVFRRNHFGHLRDQLEQRLDTKFFSTARVPSGEVLLGPVQVRFVDRNGKNTDPYKTLSSNMSLEVTSSLPYFDGVARNRPDNYSNANAAVVVI